MFNTRIETESLGSVHRGVIEVTVAHTGDRWEKDLAAASSELRKKLRTSISHKRLVMGIDKAGGK